MRQSSERQRIAELSSAWVRVEVRVRVRVRAFFERRSRVRVRGGDYFLRLHTPFSIVGSAR